MIVGNVNNNQGGTSSQIGGTAQGAGSKGGGSARSAVGPQAPAAGAWSFPSGWGPGPVSGGGKSDNTQAK